MKNLFEASSVDEVVERLESLTPASVALWGKMTAAQAVAHCRAPMAMALGDARPKRLMIGRLLGPVFKDAALNEKPMRRNTPTDPTFIVAGERDLGVERDGLEGQIRRFHDGGAAACTTNPHSFYGALTPEDWARMMYKHIDHHLQQFGA